MALEWMMQLASDLNCRR